ncbi:PAS domain-containing protein [Aestuariispira ectoiniformans]|uniref:PAS domain-containing protein n=1 Tax=Aestuariispira ectoiniformans TaxID=2775080 RepID=UPI00223A85C4|nr:PAS domain-containing protein [Aestuariispira ectoiniformans]
MVVQPDYLVDLEEITDLSPALQQAHDYWDGLRGTRAFPSRDDIDPLDIPKLLPKVELIDVLPPTADGIPDFRYRLIGTGVDDISTQFYGGRKVSDIPHQRAPSKLHSMLALVLIRKAPVTARLPYIGDDKEIEAVDNFVAPLGRDNETIDMLLSIVDPIRRRRGPSQQ